jgi:hypothetical protein
MSAHAPAHAPAPVDEAALAAGIERVSNLITKLHSVPHRRAGTAHIDDIVSSIVPLIQQIPASQSVALRRELDGISESWRRTRGPKQLLSDRSRPAAVQFTAVEQLEIPAIIARLVNGMMSDSVDINKEAHADLMQLVRRMRDTRLGLSAAAAAADPHWMRWHFAAAGKLLEPIILARTAEYERMNPQTRQAAGPSDAVDSNRSRTLRISVEYRHTDIGQAGYVTAEEMLAYERDNQVFTIDRESQNVVFIGRGKSNDIDTSDDYAYDHSDDFLVLFCGLSANVNQYVLVDLQSDTKSSSSISTCTNTSGSRGGSTTATVISSPTRRVAIASSGKHASVLWLDRDDILIKLNAGLCKTCNDHAVNTVAVACGHYSLCDTCAFDTMSRCPVCRAETRYKHSVIPPPSRKPTPARLVDAAPGPAHAAAAAAAAAAAPPSASAAVFARAPPSVQGAGSNDSGMRVYRTSSEILESAEMQDVSSHVP